MPAVRPSVWPICGEETVAFLDALAAEMTAIGWAAYVTTSPGWAPRLFVQHPRLDIVSGTVLATRDQATGEWWYWFGHAERIAPCGSPAEAAEAVGRALSPVSGSAADLAAPRTQHWAEGTRR